MMVGIKRSQFFALALEEFIVNHNGAMITEKINEAYLNHSRVLSFINNDSFFFYFLREPWICF
jgi:hypothetical protein